jgi:hypothetical protein
MVFHENRVNVTGIGGKKASWSIVLKIKNHGERLTDKKNKINRM